jgi:hypothetical protein
MPKSQILPSLIEPIPVVENVAEVIGYTLNPDDQLDAQNVGLATEPGATKKKAPNRVAIPRSIFKSHDVKIIKGKRGEKTIKMPSTDTLHGRETTVNMAFAKSLIPKLRPTREECDAAFELLGMSKGILHCSYCGGTQTTWDHFQAATLDGEPSGFIDEIDNLVPVCGTCNSSRGNKAWWIYMEGLKSAKSGKNGEKPDQSWLTGHEERVKHLEQFSEAVDPIQMNHDLLFADTSLRYHYEKYRALRNQIRDLLAEAKTHWLALVPVIDKAAFDADQTRTDGTSREAGHFSRTVPPRKTLRSTVSLRIEEPIKSPQKTKAKKGEGNTDGMPSPS